MGSFARSRNPHASDREQKRPVAGARPGASALGVTGVLARRAAGIRCSSWAIRRRRPAAHPDRNRNAARGDNATMPHLSVSARHDAGHTGL
jgi:hypothetical protein